MESRLADQLMQVFLEAMNASAATTGSPPEIAAAVMSRLEKMSAVTNAGWPEESRLRYQILDLSPAIVIKTGFRSHEGYFVAARSRDANGNAGRQWQIVDESLDFDDPWSSVGLYPLHRGPAGNPRFLAVLTKGGCAGSFAISYVAKEWISQDYPSVQQIIKLDGALGLDDKVPGFSQPGKLSTTSPKLTLPFCWFSALDTWDNPSMCAVDTYDLSGDTARFASRSYNRPDLLPVARALEYAEKRDYAAVLGYCSSARVARKLVQVIPPEFQAEEIKVMRMGPGKELITTDLDQSTRFIVQKRAEGWQVTDFTLH